MSACPCGRRGQAGAANAACVHRRCASPLQSVSASPGTPAHSGKAPQIRPCLNATRRASTRPDVHIQRCSSRGGPQRGGRTNLLGAKFMPFRPHPCTQAPSFVHAPPTRLHPNEPRLSRVFAQLALAPPLVPGHRGRTHFCASRGRPGQVFPAELEQRRRRKRRPGPQLPEQGPHGPHAPHEASAGRTGGWMVRRLPILRNMPPGNLVTVEAWRTHP